MYLVAHLHLMALRLWNRLDALARGERGDNNTISVIAWALAVIVVVGIAVAAIRGYIQTQVAKLP